MAMLLKKNILDIADFMDNIIYLAFCWLLLTGMHFKLSFVLFLAFCCLSIKFLFVFCAGVQLYMQTCYLSCQLIIVINSHWEPPLSNATRLGLVVVRGEPGGGKEHELRRQSVPSLWGGGWGDRLSVCSCPF